MNKKDRAIKAERSATIKEARRLRQVAAHGVLMVNDGPTMLRADDPAMLELLTGKPAVARGTILEREAREERGFWPAKKALRYKVRRCSGQVVWVNDMKYGNELQRPFTLRSLKADGFVVAGDAKHVAASIPAEPVPAPTKAVRLRKEVQEGIAPASTNGHAPKIGRRTETFEPGTVLTGTYKGDVYKITRTEDGAWATDKGERFASLNAAAMALLQIKAINAPKFWGLRQEGR